MVLGSRLTSAKRGSHTYTVTPSYANMAGSPAAFACEAAGERGIVAGEGGGLTPSGGTQPEGQSLLLICLFRAECVRGIKAILDLPPYLPSWRPGGGILAASLD